MRERGLTIPPSKAGANVEKTVLEANVVSRSSIKNSQIDLLLHQTI